MSARDVIKRQLRSTLLPNKNGLVPLALEKEYRGFFGKDIPFKEFGFKDLITFLHSMPDVVTIDRLRGGDLIVKAKADESTSHIQEMVVKQKDNPEGYNQLTNQILSRPVNRDCHQRNVSFVKAPTDNSVKISSKKVDLSARAQVVKIPEYLKNNLKVLLDSFSPDPNVSTEDLYNRYKLKFGETINVSDFNCSSFIEVLSLLPELVKLVPDKVSRTVLVIPVKTNEDLTEKQVAGDYGPQRDDSCLKRSKPLSSLLPAADISIDSKEGSNEDEILEVNITEVRDPGMIYVHIKDEFEEYSSIFETLMSEGKRWDINPEELVVNKKYALKMEGRWYRTKLLSAPDSKEVCTVFFVDFGFKRDCNKRDLRRLPRTMKGESYAIPIRLTGAQVIGQKWSRDSINKLKHILQSATDGFKSSLICKVDYANIGEGDTSLPIPVWLHTSGGRDINQEVVQNIKPEDAVEDDRNNNVVSRIESFLTQLKNVELSTEEVSSLEKICLRIEKILQAKGQGGALPASANPDIIRNTNAMSMDVNPGKGTNSKTMADQLTSNSERLLQTTQTSSKPNLSDVRLWSRVSLISSNGPRGVRLGIGLCYLQRSKRLVVSSMDDKRVKMFTSDGNFLKVVTAKEADDGDLTDPSAVTSLADGGFAVSDKTRVLVFDENGQYINTVWSRKDYSDFKSMMCFGLGEDVQKRLVLLLDSRDHTFLCFIDSQKSEMFCSDVRDIVKASPKSSFKFLTVVGQSFYVTDYSQRKVYSLKFSSEKKLVKDIEISGDCLKNPAGVSADSEGHIIVADYTDSGKLSVFSDKGKWLKSIEVSTVDVLRCLWWVKIIWVAKWVVAIFLSDKFLLIQGPPEAEHSPCEHRQLGALHLVPSQPGGAHQICSGKVNKISPDHLNYHFLNVLVIVIPIYIPSTYMY